MRILHIISTLDPAAGGPSESVRVLMTFPDVGYIGEVVTLDDPNESFLQRFTFPVHALGPRRFKYGINPRLFRWLRQNRHRFDGVVVNGVWGVCGLAALTTLHGKVPYVVFTHGMLDPYFKHAFPWKHVKKWLYWITVEYWVLRFAYRVLFTTKEESELARSSFWLHRWTGYVVPYGSARPPADVKSMERAFYAVCPSLKNRRFLLFLGRIHRKKGCDLLVRSFIRHAALDRGLHLVMAGPDQQGWSSELQSELRQAGLQERVHWPGMLKGDAKWGAFYASEAFILPSHQENFGIAVAEALACGRAVLLADKVNIAPEIAADGAGLMQPDTQRGTDCLLQEWIGMSVEARAAMERAALRTFEFRYDMEQNAATIVRLFGKH